jgi:hypothetical protein
MEKPRETVRNEKEREGGRQRQREIEKERQADILRQTE